MAAKKKTSAEVWADTRQMQSQLVLASRAGTITPGQYQDKMKELTDRLVQLQQHGSREPRDYDDQGDPDDRAETHRELREARGEDW